MSRTFSLVLIALLCGSTPAWAKESLGTTWRSSAEGTFKLVRFTLARTVEARQPGNSVEGAVPVDGLPVYGFVEVLNKGAASKIAMVWMRDGREVARHWLGVGRSPSWKTWSFTRATKWNQGKWTVLVRDAAGNVLAEQRVVIGS